MNKHIETAIMLLAGRGSRLEELTDNKPKCLVQVNNTPILHRMLDELSYLDIKKVILVVGYLHEQIFDYVGHKWKGMHIEYILNKDWHKTNNVVSLYMGLEKIETNFLLLEGDIIVSKEALKAFNDLNLLALDKFRDYMDGTVVKLDENKRVEKFYLKSTPGRPDDLTGLYKTVNIYSFDKNELAFAQAVNFGEISLKAVDFHNLKWAEIDDQKDLQYAEKLFD